MEGLIKGLNDVRPELASVLNDITNDFNKPFNVGVTGFNNPSPAFAAAGTQTNNINVYIQGRELQDVNGINKFVEMIKRTNQSNPS